MFLSSVHVCWQGFERENGRGRGINCLHVYSKRTGTGHKVHVCLCESTGADSDVLVSLWMEVMRLGWQLCWCQGGSARLTADVQCVIQSTAHLTLCTGALHEMCCGRPDSQCRRVVQNKSYLSRNTEMLLMNMKTYFKNPM